jgi:hypothetical protein
LKSREGAGRKLAALKFIFHPKDGVEILSLYPAAFNSLLSCSELKYFRKKYSNTVLIVDSYEVGKTFRSILKSQIF